MTKRLTNFIKPKHYNVHFALADDLKSFESISRILLQIQKETKVLELHVKDLEILSAELTLAGQDMKINSYDFNPQEDLVIFNLNQTLDEGAEVELTVSSRAIITPTMHGIYPAHYVEDGKDKTIISTQFESHHAREAFVCIDEPAAKATFDVSVNGPSDLVYISNMPIAKTKDKTTFFTTSPIMSTYLLAFAVGDFAKLSKKTKRGVEVNTYSMPRTVKHTQFALDVAADCLDFFEDYFGIEYPLPKSDLLAIPEFAVGAMENWGMVTYRETAIVNDPNNTALSNKQYIADVVCHELAHQWFGNLVTMQWWDDLWLNEGFATWASALAVNTLFPKWNIWAEFVAEDYIFALSEDALISSHPIRVPVENPKDISEIFDAISYRKGASIIRMLNQYVGADKFQAGISDYLKKFAYKNATTNDLWASLSAATNIDVAEFMKPWTEIMGFPAVSIDDNNDRLNLAQEHFLLNEKSTKQNTVWPVPLLFNKNCESDEKLFNKKSMTVPKSNGFVKINSGHSGYYRTSYSSSLQASLAKQITNLPVADRLGLLDDAIELAIAGKKPTIEVLKLIEHYKNEDKSQVWSVIAGSISSIRATLLGDENEHLLKSLVESLIKNKYSQLGWKEAVNESENDQLVRPIVLALATRFDLYDARKQLESLFSSGEIPPNLRGLVYSHKAKHGDESLYDIFWNNYLKEDLQEQKNRWARALTEFKDQDLISKNMEKITSEHIRLQDKISWCAGLMRNDKSQEAFWDWYKANWQWIESNFAAGHLYSYFVMILGFFKDESKIAEIKSFFSDKNTDGIGRSIEQVIEKIEYKAAWKNRDSQNVKDWLASQ